MFSSKQRSLQSEEVFHDQWAKTVSVKDLNVIAQFEGPTSLEYNKAIGLLPNVKNKKILNLGCGLGEEAVYLAILGAKVVAIDISSEMLKTTEKLSEKYKVNKNITFRKMSCEKMKFRKNSFDAILGCNILHHVDIKKTVKEVEKVLKPKGVAVFAEPLAHNPIINIYRRMAYEVRTNGEHPLAMSDIKRIESVFPKTLHYEFHLFTLLIFVWFFLIERQNPNEVRYWKKIINETDKYGKSFKALRFLDRGILFLLPFLKRYCWITVIKSQKQ
jgi:ubiquinone/menaquinone biosynthesis C-methylase UbiE